MGAEALWAIPGQERVAEALRRAAATDEVGHAWAFLGPHGVGQREAALALMAALACGCGGCEVCRRAVAGAHPDYHELTLTGSAHRVEDVRERWLPVAHRTASAGPWKVLRVEDADRMNDAAANAFLKALEEPPAGTVWILDVADVDALPETVLSRCRTARFRPLDAATLDALAREWGLDDPDDRALVVRACHGSPRRLTSLAEGDGLAALRRHREIPRRLRQGSAQAIVAAHAVTQRAEDAAKAAQRRLKTEREALEAAHGDAPPRALVRELEQREQREAREARLAELIAALDDVAGWYRDVLFVQAGGDPAAAVHADDPDGLVDDAAALPAATLLACLDRVLDARRSLERNAQPRLALDACFLDLAARSLAARR